MLQQRIQFHYDTKQNIDQNPISKTPIKNETSTRVPTPALLENSPQDFDEKLPPQARRASFRGYRVTETQRILFAKWLAAKTRPTGDPAVYNPLMRVYESYCEFVENQIRTELPPHEENLFKTRKKQLLIGRLTFAQLLLDTDVSNAHGVAMSRTRPVKVFGLLLCE